LEGLLKRFKAIEDAIPKFANNFHLLQQGMSEKVDNNFNKLLAFVKKNKEQLQANDEQKLKIFANELNRYV